MADHLGEGDKGLRKADKAWVEEDGFERRAGAGYGGWTGKEGRIW